MTDEILFFDTDCISAFLWIDNTSIITALYGQRIAIPTQVYNELSACRGQAIVLKDRIDTMISNGEAIIVNMDIDSTEYQLYSKLAITPDKGSILIGRGEAACIALSKERNGILASNNLRDIKKYIELYNLKHKTTGDILVDAYNKKLLRKKEIETLWAEMLAKRRKLGADTFDNYLKHHYHSSP